MAAIIRDITIEQGGAMDEEFLLKVNGAVFDLTGSSIGLLGVGSAVIPQTALHLSAIFLADLYRSVL